MPKLLKDKTTTRIRNDVIIVRREIEEEYTPEELVQFWTQLEIGMDNLTAQHDEQNQLLFSVSDGIKDDVEGMATQNKKKRDEETKDEIEKEKSKEKK